ncbi:hypothetical protein ACCO45_012310 [Purpureocillium lilacinum]|uniref:Uncharacterized protein n=1 Tax=Purpureocillium lilacinum TaxID=33203 RepID=A0ACC4D979_PURLI
MPAESQQANLQQPWKKWHAALNPWGRKDVREGNVILKNADSGHGTVAVDQKNIDLKAAKEVPKIPLRVDPASLKASPPHPGQGHFWEASYFLLYDKRSEHQPYSFVADVSYLSSPPPQFPAVGQLALLPEELWHTWTLSGTRMTRSLTQRETARLEATLANVGVVYIQALDLLFGLPAQHISDWPGIHSFCRYLEGCLQELLDPRFSIIWKIVQKIAPSASSSCWKWCFVVIETFEAMQEEDPSIEKAYQKLLENANWALDEVTPEEKTHILQAIFAVLCWVTTMLRPILSLDSVDMLEIHRNVLPPAPFLVAENSSQIYASGDTRRPISKMFFVYRNALPPAGQDTPALGSTIHSSIVGVATDDLHESRLNYFSLFTIGRVRVKWVDTLTAHLDFNQSTRTLCIFRFPSLCVTHVLRQREVKVLRNIVIKMLASNHPINLAQDQSALYREVLLSYRLLFGQTPSARRLVAQLLSQQSSATSNAAESPMDSHMNGITDPFLRIICTLPVQSPWWYLTFNRRRANTRRWLPGNIFPDSALDINNELQESDTYSAKHDFPVFGGKLLTLQSYNMRQQPRRVKDLWLDRRNPLQWYTFWAVLWVGGAGIVLAILQVVVGVAQLVYAARSAG